MNDDERALADQPLDDLDAEILARLAEALDDIDPMPAHLTREIKAALTWAALDAELAEITEFEPALRSDPASEAEPIDSVAFTSSQLSFMVRLSGEPGARRVDGWVTGGGVLVELQVGGQVLSAESDVHGRVEWTGVPDGPLRFLIHPPGATRPVITPQIDM